AAAVDAVRDDARVAVINDGSDIAGFLPVQMATKRLAMPVGAPLCDFQALIARPDLEFDPTHLPCAFGADRFDFCHFLASQTAFKKFHKSVEPSHVVRVEDGFDAYIEERRASGSKVDRRVRTRRKKMERNFGPVTVEAFSDDRDAFEQMLVWKRAQYKRTHTPDVFKTSWTVDLIHRIFEADDPDFGGALFVLRVGDRIAAVNFCLRSETVLHGWFLAHDPELSTFSPGLVLFVELIRAMDGTPYTCLDLGPGDYQFKLSLANDARMIAQGFVGCGSVASMARRAQYEVAQLARRLPLGRAARWPEKAMRRLDLYRALR
ncbi:MAG: GNAT family N-acetyltransferase, partial [Pirellulales bacterium]|nr:GNAT family N-acetyltransferase [Pirellulales bacterium]